MRNVNMRGTLVKDTTTHSYKYKVEMGHTH